MNYRGSLLVCVGLVSCLTPMPTDQPCVEAGYAIARRSYECSGDAADANQRHEAFEAGYRCVPADWSDDLDSQDPVDGRQLFDCAFAMGELACELVT